MERKVKKQQQTNKPPSHFAWSCDSWILWMFSYPDHLTVKPALILIKISKSAIRPCMDTLACELTHIHTQQAIRKPSYNPSSQELVDVAKSFLERRKERMTERQMLRGLRGISVFLTLIHWHISVSWQTHTHNSAQINVIILIYGPAIDPLAQSQLGLAPAPRDA